MRDATGGPGEAITGPLSQTRPWMKFLAVMGFISCGLILLDGFFMLLGTGLVPDALGATSVPHGIIALMVLFYLAGSIFFYLVPSILLMRAARSLNGIEKQCDLNRIASIAERQHKFWRYCGMLMIVGISVALFFMLIAALMIPFTAGRLH